MPGSVSDPEVTIDPGPGPIFPDPAQRRRVPTPQGIPVRLGDGQTWILAHGCLAPGLLGLTDELFDKLVLTKAIPLGPVLQVAWRLLVANYDLADGEVQALLEDARDEDLANAVMDALIGPHPPRRTWSTWALSSLYANGIEPANVPPWLIPEVLHQLVQTGRAMPSTDSIDSASAAVARAALWARLPKPGAVRQHPDAPPAMGGADPFRDATPFARADAPDA